MKRPQAVHRIRTTTPMVVLAAAFIATGGFLHLREWLDVYRDVPASAPGAAVVRVGFPVSAALSILLVAGLYLVFRRPSRLTQPAVLAAVAFEGASLATLVASRVGSVFGWSEPVWTSGAEQIRAVEAAAIVALLALAAANRRDRTSSDEQVSDLDDADLDLDLDEAPGGGGPSGTVAVAG